MWSAAPLRQPPWKRRLRRELSWFSLTFGVPFLLLHGLDLLPQDGGAPWWKRLLLIEDACPYGVCLWIPAGTYVVSRLASVVHRRGSRVC